MNYIKYGLEWEREVMKNNKLAIVDMLRRVAIRCDELEATKRTDVCRKCGSTELIEYPEDPRYLFCADCGTRY